MGTFKTVLISILFGMLGAYLLGIISHKFGPLPLLNKA